MVTYLYYKNTMDGLCTTSVCVMSLAGGRLDVNRSPVQAMKHSV